MACRTLAVQVWQVICHIAYKGKGLKHYSTGIQVQCSCRRVFF
uniref:Uncharacterized protein n=1 Tax=Arundo donax TaxID=35708 RepID=A0A0A8XWT8_ARUDO